MHQQKKGNAEIYYGGCSSDKKGMQQYIMGEAAVNIVEYNNKLKGMQQKKS